MPLMTEIQVKKRLRLGCLSGMDRMPQCMALELFGLVLDSPMHPSKSSEIQGRPVESMFNLHG